MTQKVKTIIARTLEGGSSTGGWYWVITTGLDFLRDVIPPSFPESGITFIGALLATIAGGATTATVHSTLKTHKNKKG